MFKSEYVHENETHKILRDLHIQADHPIQARRPDPHFINNQKRVLENVAVPVDHNVKVKESESVDKYLDLARELKSCGTC